MNIKDITNDITYVGVNDRSKVRFEGLWPLPYGVSYNSYIVKDEKNALIDTVELHEMPDLLDNLAKQLPGGTLHYLVVNHMEPDHSSGIPTIVDKFPDIKIVGNKQTISMIQGFYHIMDPDRFIEVKDGDEISLGSKTLKFVLTPMVHWPETMMTFCPETGTLFSGDAFGAFGALDGGVIDSELDIEVYYREMYRYYSNIVGKYGVYVQRAMAKVANNIGLDNIKYICSTHGPIWHKYMERTVALYDRLSRYEGEDGVVIVYGTMYGNTSQLVEAIAESLSARGVKPVIVHNACTDEMSDIISDAFRYKGLIVGSPTYSMTILPPVETFLRAMETREVKNKVMGAFGSFAWAPAALKEIKEFAQIRLKSPVVGEISMKQGFSEALRPEIEAMADNICAALSVK